MKCRVFLVLWFLAQSVLAQKGFFTGVPSSWVAPAAYHLEPRDTSNTSGGYYYLLVERQHDAEREEMYKRYAIKVVSEKGLQFASSISESYDPAFQTLTFHAVQIIRNGNKIDRLEKNRFKIIQREESLDRHIYDGSLSAILDLSGVQVGDIVEYSCTIKGQNPTFKKKFFNSFYLNYGVPAGKISYKIFAANSRKLHFKYFVTDSRVSSKSLGGQTEYSIEVDNPVVTLSEDGTPNWYETLGRFEVSEFETNEDLGKWAKGLFVVAETSQADFREKVRQIKSEYNAFEKQVVATIQFVQDEIRYLSLSDGISAYQPHPPNEVFKQRFGDCKDKSLLLVNMLNELGVKSTAVLVNTYYGKTLPESLPSPWNFNHCIVKMTLNDSAIWIDPTISSQRGSLKNIYIPTYHHGLNITEEKLEKIPFGFQDSSIKIAEQFDIAQVGTSATLMTETAYSGDEAVSIRIYRQSNSQEEIDKSYLNFYATDYPNIAKKTSVEFKDDVDANTLVTTESYTINPFWTYDSAQQQYRIEIYPRILAGYIKNPETKIRKNPFGLTYPLDISQTITLKLTEEWNVTTKEQKIESAGFVYTSSIGYADNVVTLSYRYKTKKDFIEASEVKDHLEKVKKINDNISFQLTYSNTKASTSSFNWQFLIICLLAMAASTYAIFRMNKYDPAPANDGYENHSQIGGWLIVFAIGLLLSPLFNIYSLITNDYFNPIQWRILADSNFTGYNPALGTLVVLEMIGTIFLIWFGALCIFLFFQRRTSAPRLIIIFSLTSLVFGIADVYFASHYFALFDQAEVEKNWIDVMKQVVRVVIWVPYFIHSERVKGTFTETLTVTTNSSYP